MNLFDAVFLGLLQGLTEFLPVSSSGHLAIAQHFMPGFEPPGLLFEVMLHLGTMLAVILYFWRDLALLATAWFRSGEEAMLYRRLFLLLILASVPTAIIGLTFKDFFTGLFDNIAVVSLMLLVTGTVLFLSERFRHQERGEKELTVMDALFAGTVQGAAIIPGISRSGSTIAALLIKGVDGATAARFSFLMALPAVLGAALLELSEVGGNLGGDLPAYLAGTGVAFFSGMLAIRFLLAVIRKRRLFAFAIYCWMAGSLFFFLSQ